MQIRAVILEVDRETSVQLECLDYLSPQTKFWIGKY